MRRDRRRSPLLAACGAVAAAAGLHGGPARAHEAPEAMRRVSFQVERSQDVANDTVRAIVGATGEDADPAALAKRINETMAWALGIARKAPGVKVESGAYQTFPVHEQGRIRRWRASQEAILESADAESVSQLLGELQSRLELRGLDFSVSPERRREVEEGLVIEALAAFEARAKLVSEKLGARSYQIVQISIDTGAGVIFPQRSFGARALAAEVADLAPPALEAGSSRVTVGLSATIELD